MSWNDSVGEQQSDILNLRFKGALGKSTKANRCEMISYDEKSCWNGGDKVNSLWRSSAGERGRGREQWCRLHTWKRSAGTLQIKKINPGDQTIRHYSAQTWHLTSSFPNWHWTSIEKEPFQVTDMTGVAGLIWNSTIPPLSHTLRYVIGTN